MTASPKTTIAGVIYFLDAFFGQIKFLVDSDPNTNPDYNTIIAAAILTAGLFLAKDK